MKITVQKNERAILSKKQSLRWHLSSWRIPLLQSI